MLVSRIGRIVGSHYRIDRQYQRITLSRLVVQHFRRTNTHMDYPEAPRFHIEEVDSARLDKFSGEEFESFYEQNVGARSGYEEFTCEAFLDGSRIGAIHGNYYWGGLNIHRLAVLPPFRSARVGTTLLRRICRKGASAGARLANLTTMDYQGPRYFPKFGFINNFILAPVADGHSIYYFTKPLPSSETDSDTDTGTSISIQTRGPAAAHHVITLRDSDAAPTSEQHAFFRSVFDQHNEECTGRDAGFKMFSFGAVDDDDGSLLGTGA